MENDDIIFYNALKAHDSRFDGVFFVGVTSTGIYCRPICTAKLPKKENCRFFKNAESAEKEFFRPCLRCRPELAPGSAPIDDAQRIAHLLVSQIEEGLFEEKGLESVASHFKLSSRQIRRIMQKEFGVSPIEFILTRRLLLAKQLLTETNLTITEVAFASGFSSLRRFNDAFKKRYQMPPSFLRKEKIKIIDSEMIHLQLSYRPPYDWIFILNFLTNRRLEGVEYIENDKYFRTVCLGKFKGWISVSHLPQKNSIEVAISAKLIPTLPLLLNRLRYIFDLNARPDVINSCLMQDSRFAKSIRTIPGLRVPGCFDGFELAIRAILGQQISVKAATTVASRFIKKFGEPINTSVEQLHYLWPTPEVVSLLIEDDIASLGIIRRRAQSIILLAKAIVDGTLNLNTIDHPEQVIEKLTSIPGIGKWTAQYIIMRALHWPDAFPKEDIILQKSLGNVSAKVADSLSQAWRPWRSYATLHLWHMWGSKLNG